MRNDVTWLKYYAELKKYKNKYGNTNVPSDYVTDDNVKLGLWFKKQKHSYQSGTLYNERIKLFEQLGVVWNIHEDKWNNAYEHLKDYYAKYNDIDVPRSYVSIDGFCLGNWLEEQRVLYKAGYLAKNRAKLLKALNIKWNPRIDNWDKFYYILEEYYEQNNNIDVPVMYVTDDNVKLGKWLNVQRQAYNGTWRSKISQDRIMLLNDLGMDWSSHDTKLLNRKIVDNDKYHVVLLERMKHILEDLAYETDGNITDENKQKEIEKEIIKRMWK